MPRSMRILNIKTGIVIFVGNAARFVTRAIAMADIARINKLKLFPVKITTITVSGVKMQPCAVRAIPSHNNLDSSWLLHQFIKRVRKEGANDFSLYLEGIA
jgi:hypothetical protein